MEASQTAQQTPVQTDKPCLPVKLDINAADAVLSVFSLSLVFGAWCLGRVGHLLRSKPADTWRNFGD
ncbi:MAG: hypothetical protein JWP36_2398 [Paucimonas sp.]|jgi:hypothetical protein|nr:hypothetical protein [Paucimonas sp.]